jgi:hypothetical protein
VSDIFQEVDEEVRREQFQKLWDRYGIFVIALAILIVAGVGGWRAYDYFESKKAAEAGARFDNAALLAEQGKHTEAQAAFAKLAVDGTAGYRLLARLREAAELAATDPKAAVAAYDALAGNSTTGQPLQDLAAARAGLILVDTAPFDEMARRMEPLAGAGAPFRHTARELLALSAWRAGKSDEVKKWSDQIRTDPETPPALRARIDVLTALATDGGKS